MTDSIRELLAGAKPITDPVGRCGDLEYYLSDGDCDAAEGDDRLEAHRWFEVEAPTGAFGCNFTPDELSRGDAGREAEREEKIKTWAKDKGGWAAALAQSPVLAVIGKNHLIFVDGWHRTKLARLDGVATVTTAVGIHPKYFDSLKGVCL